MANGNRYAAAMGPPAAGPDPSQMGPPPPQSPPPPQGQQGPSGGPPPDPQGGTAPNPALVEALQMLQGHEGRVIDLLKDPAKLPHVRLVFDTLKQDPGAVQALAQAGIGPEKLQQFEQMLAQAEQGAGSHGRSDTGQPAPHWLAR